MKEILELFKYAISVNNPFISVPFFLIIAFLLFAMARKFFDTEFITKSKEDRDSLRQLNETLSRDYERIKDINYDLKLEITKLTKEVEELKGKIEVE